MSKLRSETPCKHFPGRNCLHRGCYLETLPPRVAARLRANDSARDYRDNWGKLLYVEREHGRDPGRRKLMAAALRALRNDPKTYAGVVVAGAWAGALTVTKSHDCDGCGRPMRPEDKDETLCPKCKSECREGTGNFTR